MGRVACAHICFSNPGSPYLCFVLHSYGFHGRWWRWCYGLGYHSHPGGTGGIPQGNNQGGYPHNGNPQGNNQGGYPHNGNLQGNNQGGSPHSDSPQGINLSGYPHSGYPQGDNPGGSPQNGNPQGGNHGGIQYPQWAGHSNGKGGKGDNGGYDINGNVVPGHDSGFDNGGKGTPMKGATNPQLNGNGNCFGPNNGGSGKGFTDWSHGSPQFVGGKGGNGGSPMQQLQNDGKGGPPIRFNILHLLAKVVFPCSNLMLLVAKVAVGPMLPQVTCLLAVAFSFPQHPDLPQTSGGYPMQQPQSFGKGGSPAQQPPSSGGKGGYPNQQPQTSGGKGGYSNIQYYPSRNGKGGNYNKGYNGSSMQFKWCASCGSQNQINHEWCSMYSTPLPFVPKMGYNGDNQGGYPPGNSQGNPYAQPLPLGGVANQVQQPTQPGGGAQLVPGNAHHGKGGAQNVPGNASPPHHSLDPARFVSEQTLHPGRIPTVFEVQFDLGQYIPATGMSPGLQWKSCSEYLSSAKAMQAKIDNYAAFLESAEKMLIAVTFPAWKHRKSLQTHISNLLEGAIKAHKVPSWQLTEVCGC